MKLFSIRMICGQLEEAEISLSVKRYTFKTRDCTAVQSNNIDEVSITTLLGFIDIWFPPMSDLDHFHLPQDMCSHCAKLTRGMFAYHV
jgi:hypothetical protein